MVFIYWFRLALNMVCHHSHLTVRYKEMLLIRISLNTFGYFMYKVPLPNIISTHWVIIQWALSNVKVSQRRCAREYMYTYACLKSCVTTYIFRLTLWSREFTNVMCFTVLYTPHRTEVCQGNGVRTLSNISEVWNVFRGRNYFFCLIYYESTHYTDIESFESVIL